MLSVNRYGDERVGMTNQACEAPQAGISACNLGHKSMTQLFGSVSLICQFYGRVPQLLALDFPDIPATYK